MYWLVALAALALVLLLVIITRKERSEAGAFKRKDLGVEPKKR